MDPKQLRRFRIVTILIGVTLGAIAGELFLRGLETYHRRNNRFQPQRVAQAKDLPALSSVFDLASPNQEGIYRGRYHRTNSHGIRGGEIGLEKPEGVYRILVGGDSFAMGSGVNEDQAFPIVLQRLLNEKINDDVQFQVINLGIAGLNSDITIDNRITRLGLKFSPDLIIYAWTVNDIEGKHYRNSSTARVAPMFRQYRSRLYGLFARRVAYIREMVAPPRGSYMNELIDNYFRNPDAWNRFENSLDRLAEAGTKANACAVIVILPQMSTFNMFHPFKRFYHHVTAASEARGIPVINIFPAFRGETARRFWVSPADSHPNEEGHEIIGRSLFDGLLDLPNGCFDSHYSASE